MVALRMAVSGLMINQSNQKSEAMFTKDVITCLDNNINNMTAIDMIASILIMKVNEVKFQFLHMMILPIKETKLQRRLNRQHPD